MVWGGVDMYMYLHVCPVQNRYMYVLYTHVLYSTYSAGVYPRPYGSLSRIEYSTQKHGLYDGRVLYMYVRLRRHPDPRDWYVLTGYT